MEKERGGEREGAGGKWREKEREKGGGEEEVGRDEEEMDGGKGGVNRCERCNGICDVIRSMGY